MVPSEETLHHLHHCRKDEKVKEILGLTEDPVA